MSTATETPSRVRGASTIKEEYRCLDCDGYIESKLVVSHIDWEAYPPKRSIQCRCVHCSKTFAADYALRGGVWNLEQDTVRELVRKADLAKFERAIAKKRVA